MTGNIVLITGGSRGIGKEMALALAEAGHDVIITYASQQEAATQVVSAIKDLGRNAAALWLDLDRFGEIAAFKVALEGLLNHSFEGRKLSYLVNNAGMGATVPFVKSDEALFDRFMNVHFKGVYFLTQTLLELLSDVGGIINISSGTTRFAIPGYSVYASMKGAVETLTKYLAKELGERQIRANIVAPGPVETDFNNAAVRSMPELKARLSSLSPLGRVGQVDDIAGVVVFLCSPAAKWINGQRIEVSGGINV